MHIWLPTIRTGTGTDRYTVKLSAALQRRNIRTTLQWFSLPEEVMPISLVWATPPRSATHTHINTWLPAVGPKARTPLIATAHTYSESALFDAYKRPAQRVYHRLVIRPRIAANVRRAVATYGVSSGVCAHYMRDYGAHLRCIPNWLGPDDAIESCWRTTGSATVLFIGRPGWHKGSDLLPEIARRLPRNIRLVCTLSANEWAEAPPENVELCGRVDRSKLATLLCAADLVVVPSRHEGFSLAALEALASGVPVVGFLGSGIDDVVCDQETGCLVSMGNTKLLAEAIISLLENPVRRRILGKQAQDWAWSQFSDAVVVPRLISLYEAFGDAASEDH